MNKTRIHFAGIAGSGISAVAQLSLKLGFEVSGCDPSESTEYLREDFYNEIDIDLEHSETHVKRCDLVVTNRVLLQESGKVPETILALSQNKAISWQQFLSEYIIRDRPVIYVSGTHGKTTTTSIIGELLRGSILDPTVILGGKVVSWGNNYRKGNSEWYLVEADEYDDNFRYYHPSVLVITNLEFEHPDVYDNYQEYESAFARLISRSKMGSVIVFNSDDINVVNLVSQCLDNYGEAFELVCFGTKRRPKWVDEADFLKFQNSQEITEFYWRGVSTPIEMKLKGQHNSYNAAAAFATCAALGPIPFSNCARLKQFAGAARRIEVTYESDRFLVVDDYAHHPTEVQATLSTLKAEHPRRELIAILEMHLLARATEFFDAFDAALQIANRVYYAQIFEPTLSSTNDNLRALFAHSQHKDAHLLSDESIEAVIRNGDIKPIAIVTLGAGNSRVINKRVVECILEQKN